MQIRIFPDRIVLTAVLGLCLIASVGVVSAQPDADMLPAEPAEPALTMSARYHIETGTDTGFLIVRLELPMGSHIYSMTQPKPLKPSKILVAQSETFVTEKIFKSDTRPQVIEDDPLFHSRIEKFAGTVQFYVPIKVDASADPDGMRPLVTYSGQLCSEDGYCVLVDNLTAKAEFAGYFQREAKNPVPPLRVRK